MPWYNNMQKVANSSPNVVFPQKEAEHISGTSYQLTVFRVKAISVKMLLGTDVYSDLSGVLPLYLHFHTQLYVAPTVEYLHNGRPDAFLSNTVTNEYDKLTSVRVGF